MTPSQSLIADHWALWSHRSTQLLRTQRFSTAQASRAAAAAAHGEHSAGVCGNHRPWCPTGSFPLVAEQEGCTSLGTRWRAISGNLGASCSERARCVRMQSQGHAGCRVASKQASLGGQRHRRRTMGGTCFFTREQSSGGWRAWGARKGRWGADSSSDAGAVVARPATLATMRATTLGPCALLEADGGVAAWQGHRRGRSRQAGAVEGAPLLSD